MATLGILGCGEAFDSGWGNNSCILHGASTPTVLFDCGYQIPERLWALSRRLQDLDAVILTHLHADHALGMAPLLVRMMEEKRMRALTVFGSAGAESYLRKAVELAYPGAWRRLGFPLDVRLLAPGKKTRWRGLELECAESVHSVRNLAVRVALGKGSFFISGDGRFTEASLSLASRSKLVLHEAYSARRGHPTHTSLIELHDALHGSTPEHIVVTHPQRDERESVEIMIRRLARRDPRWICAAPGQSYPIRAK
ncbi:MAG: ribonuclease Z [Bdellovibrionales bacterium]|nr:ribonuclease Z [Bdellovibrionales bacterium]